MRARDATTAVLVVLAAAVGVYAFVVDRAGVPESERTARAQNLLPVYRREDVTGIELTPASGPALAVVREAVDASASSPFRMTAPVEGAVDAAAVDALLASLEHATPVRTVDAAITPAELGVEAPRLRGTLRMGRVTYRLALGNDAPTPPGAAYLRVDDVGTFVVARELVVALTRPADDFRDRAFAAFDPAAVGSFEVARGASPARRFTRLDALSFRLGDDGPRAPRDPVDRVLTALAQLRAEAFVPPGGLAFPTSSPAPADAPTTRVRVTLTSGAPPIALVVGGACPSSTPGVLVTRTTAPAVSACIALAVAEPLDAILAADAAFDRALFAAHDDEVEEVHLALDGATGDAARAIDFARKGAGFHERSPDDRELAGADADVAHALVAALVHARGEAVPAPPSRGAAVARVRIARASGLGDEEVRLDADGVVTRAADGVALRVSRDVARSLTPGALTLRSAAVFSDAVDPGGVQSISSRCNGLTQSIARDASGALVYVAPAGYAVDVATVLDTARVVFRARAERWVAASDDGTFGFAQSTCSIDVGVTADDGGVAHAQLGFGADAYAREGTRGAVFVASPALREGAAQIFVDRHAFHVDPRDLARVTLARGSRRVVFAAAANADLDAGVTFDTVASVFDGLRADGVKSLGEALSGDEMGSPRLDVTLDVVARDAEPHASARRHIALGATLVVAGRRMVCARMDGVRATFLIARERLAPLFSALDPLPAARE